MNGYIISRTTGGDIHITFGTDDGVVSVPAVSYVHIAVGIYDGIVSVPAV